MNNSISKDDNLLISASLNETSYSQIFFFFCNAVPRISNVDQGQLIPHIQTAIGQSKLVILIVKNQNKVSQADD